MPQMQAGSANTRIEFPPSGRLMPSGSTSEQYNYAFGLLKQADYPAAEAALNKTRADVLMKKQQREQERLTLNELLGFPPEVILQLQSQDEISWTKALPPLQEFTDQIEDRRLERTRPASA